MLGNKRQPTWGPLNLAAEADLFTSACSGSTWSMFGCPLTCSTRRTDRSQPKVTGAFITSWRSFLPVLGTVRKYRHHLQLSFVGLGERWGLFVRWSRFTNRHRGGLGGLQESVDILWTCSTPGHLDTSKSIYRPPWYSPIKRSVLN